MAINLNILASAETVTVDYVDIASMVNGEFVKQLRKDNGYTQVRLANLLHVTKKAVEKWEQGKNHVSGSSAVLMYLLKEKPELADLIVKTNVKSGWAFDVEEQETVKGYKATDFEANAYYRGNCNLAVASC